MIVVDKATGSVLGKWGPRPNGATDLITDYKNEFGTIDDTAKANLQLWYLHNKGLSTQDEMINLMFDLEQ